MPYIEQFWQRILNQIGPNEDYYLVDSMPFEVCKYSRANWSKVCAQTAETVSDHGYCGAQKMYCFGYKIHAVWTPSSVFKTFDISKASVHDIHYFNDLKSTLKRVCFGGG